MSLRKLLSDKTLVLGGSWLLFERLFFIAKGFILSLLFANLLSKEVFGAYQFVMALVGTACVFALPGMATAIIQAVARGHGGTLRAGVVLMLRYAWGGSIFLLAALYAMWQEHSTVGLLWLLAPLLPLYAVVVGAWRSFFTGKERFREAAIIGMWGEGLTLLVFLGVIFFFPTEVALVLVAFFTPLVFYGTVLLKNLKETRGESVDESNLAFGKRLSWLYGVGVAASYLDKLIIGHFLGFAELAIFTIASIIPDQIRDAVRVVVGFVLPGFSRMDDTTTNRRTILKGIGVLFIIVTGLVGLYILLAPWLFRIFFAQYQEAITYTQVAALASLTVPLMILDSYFRARKDDKTATRVALSGYAAGTMANLVLIPLFGIWGAIIARAVALTVNGLLFLVAFLQKGFSKPEVSGPQDNVSVAEKNS